MNEGVPQFQPPSIFVVDSGTGSFTETLEDGTDLIVTNGILYKYAKESEEYGKHLHFQSMNNWKNVYSNESRTDSYLFLTRNLPSNYSMYTCALPNLPVSPKFVRSNGINGYFQQIEKRGKMFAIAIVHEDDQSTSKMFWLFEGDDYKMLNGTSIFEAVTNWEKLDVVPEEFFNEHPETYVLK